MHMVDLIDKTIEKLVKSKLKEIDIEINGSRPEDLQIHNNKVYSKSFFKGSLGLGEAYMDNWWDANDLETFLTKIFKSGAEHKLLSNFVLITKKLTGYLFNMQTPLRSLNVGKRHYDTGNKLYEYMLGKTMAYSCGYWKNSNTLDEAQEAKFRLIFDKLKLEPGMKILDIGCGWGTAAEYAAKNYGVEVVGITISKEQAEYARNRTKDLPIKIVLKDYRTLEEKFDRIYSIGMFEHVGPKNYKTFMKKTSSLLNPDGLLLLHTIGSLKSLINTDPWVEKYIFPGGTLPSIAQTSKSTEGVFVIEDLQNFGYDYSRTLREWRKNFIENWDEIRKLGYDDRFYRMWIFYLTSFIVTFKIRRLQLYQFVLSPKGVKGRYDSPR